ncbi:MAG: hypothetical protein U0237_20030 [Thermoleophilia bacterium]
MTKSLRLPLAVLAALLLVVPAAFADGTTKNQEVAVLYSMDATRTVVAKSGKTFRVSMPANSGVTWFTDRPNRKAGYLTLKQFYAMWQGNGFDTDPPNAALLLTRKGVETTHVVEMTDPKLDNGRVSFAVRPVKGATEAGHRHRHPLKAGNFGRSRLFIDDATLSPCSPSIYGPSGVTAVGPALQQCLLAPGKNVWAYSQAASSGHYTVVSACATGATYSATTNLVTIQRAGTWLPYAPGSAIHGCESTVNLNAGHEGWMASWGFDAYNAPEPSAGSVCPNPPNDSSHVSLTNPTTSGYTLRISVQQGTSLSCTNEITTVVS